MMRQRPGACCLAPRRITQASCFSCGACLSRPSRNRHVAGEKTANLLKRRAMIKGAFGGIGHKMCRDAKKMLRPWLAENVAHCCGWLRPCMRMVTAITAASIAACGAGSVRPMATIQLEKQGGVEALEILTRRELADRLKCSTRHLDAQIGKGMPAHMLGRTRRFILPEVVAWLRRQAR